METVITNVTLHQPVTMTVDVWDGIIKDIVCAVYFQQHGTYDIVTLKGETEHYSDDNVKAIAPANLPENIVAKLHDLSVCLNEKKTIEDNMRQLQTKNNQALMTARRELRVATQIMTNEEFADALHEELHKYTDMDARVSILCYAEGDEMIVVDDVKHVKRNAFINDFPFISRYMGRGRITIDEKAEDYKKFVESQAPETDKNLEAISWRISTGSEIDGNNRMNVYSRYFVKLSHGFSRKSINEIISRIKVYA